MWFCKPHQDDNLSMDLVGSCVRGIRLEKGLSQKELAHKAGIDPSNLSKLERGDYTWTKENLQRLADALDVPTQAFFHLDRSPKALANVETIPTGKRKIPILDSVQAGAWTEVFPNLADGSYRDFMLTDRRYSERAFAMRVKGESMLPRFQEGDVVVVDPEHPPSPGSYVVASNGDGEATLKQYAARGTDAQGNEIFELIPSNPLFASIRSDTGSIRIIGTVRERTELFR